MAQCPGLAHCCREGIVAIQCAVEVNLPRRLHNQLVSD
jgi:hypothetical protein